MPSRTREVVVAWLDARGRRDLDALAELTAEHARWESPVVGTVEGRDAVVRQVEEGYADTDAFATRVLALECRTDQAVAVLHNTGRRAGKELDSLQTLFLRLVDDRVAEVKVSVDDESAVAAFWDDDPSVDEV